MEDINLTYEIVELLGQGSGGYVYKAFHKRLKKYVVLKQLKYNRETQINRIEVDILKNLKHSYLPQVIDFLETPQGIFTVMDYISGRNLEEVIKSGTVLSEKQIIRIATEVADALAYLHSQKYPILHGDIKPNNIMLTDDGHICLFDFNVSAVLGDQSSLIFGCTKSYASPEQLMIMDELKAGKQASVKIDQRSDIFSLGATIYFLIEHKKWSYNYQDLKNLHASDGLTAILYKCLNPAIASRYRNAGELHEALKNVYKKDKKYKNMIFKQNLTYIFISMFLAVSVFFIFQGNRTMKLEKQEKYQELVMQLDSSLSKEEFDDIYHEAILLFPDRIEAFYAKACYIHDNETYENAIKYIESVIYTGLEGTDVNYANFYYLNAECYFQLEDYSNAAVYFKTSLNYEDTNPEVYRDYAISQVHLNKIDDAKDTLDTAISYGLDEAGIYMVQGEIAKMEGNYELCIQDMIHILELTDDPFIMERSYVIGSQAYGEMNTVESLTADTNWLNQGIEKLPGENRLLIYERLVQDYINLGEQQGNSNHYVAAIDVLKKIISANWSTSRTYSNIIILYQRMNDFSNAYEYCNKMLQLYPEDYHGYMRMAFVEAGYQNTLGNTNRDYHRFAEYYDKANNLYKSSVSGNVTDSEMLLLSDTFQQVKDGGWLK